jgi:hypothetical protein
MRLIRGVNVGHPPSMIYPFPVVDNKAPIVGVHKYKYNMIHDMLATI